MLLLLCSHQQEALGPSSARRPRHLICQMPAMSPCSRPPVLSCHPRERHFGGPLQQGCTLQPC
jgi:hypothetical protein